MTRDTLHRIDALFARFRNLCGEGVSEEEINEASLLIGLPFPEDYREFLKRYGAGIVGSYPIFGLRRVRPMGNAWSVVDVNKEKAKRWPDTGDWLIISEDLSGNPVGVTSDGTVWIADYELASGVSPLAENFESFLRKYCLEL